MSAGTSNLTVAVDTMTLMWGIRQVGPAEVRKRVRWLSRTLDEQDALVIIPSVVAAEYLTGVQERSRAHVLAELSKRFFVAPFDLKCAPLAAKLWQKGSKGRNKGKPDNRKCFRADTLIVATAHIHGAEEFYSADPKCRALARGLMKACDLPEIAPDLFEDAERKASKE